MRIVSQGITRGMVRRSIERGHFNYGWLNTHHTFSFANYYDPRFIGFRSLRVINEDIVAPGQGFDPHPHEDMEILTYVVDGALKHEDSEGHESVVPGGSIQKITAGRGIIHSEYNASPTRPVHFLQVWIAPSRKGLAPSYQERILPAPDPKHPLLLIASSEEGGHAVYFHQDVRIFRGVMEEKQVVVYPVDPGRGVWVQMISGQLKAGGFFLSAGDGISLEHTERLHLSAEKPSEFLLFDLA